MSDVADQYLTRAKQEVEEQYTSIKLALDKTQSPQECLVKRVSFVAGARSLIEQNLRHNLALIKIPQASIESIRSKLAFMIFDEYVNVLKGMYRMRFNGRPADGGASTQTHSVPDGPGPPLVTSLIVCQPTQHRKWKKGETVMRERTG